ncbi:FAD-binding oxidoreductase [Kribbia dieselivorans]|uniref:FAD-binding oxidoreductase n=1 Tax=Kribbia dieselivorans TaxID=331526 RepID=UPI0008388035|nr:FAD-binding oxidoreductase [Kribbia dieselivorans]
MTQLAQIVDMITPKTTARRLAKLAQRCSAVHLPGSPAYDQGRFAWNVAVDQRPGAVALPETIEDLCHLVRHAGKLGLRVTTQTTGHAASVLAQHDLSDVVLVRTTALRGVHIDPARRIARVEAGAVWQDVVDAAAPHGLAALHGSAHDVGVVGYTLGGGLSWYARKHGLASNNVVGIELITPEGEVVRADAHHRTDLFWALRGGGGNFGVVTTIEISLLPIEDVYAGMMIWPLDRAPEVLRTYAAWSASAPDEITASLRFLRFPPLPELPDFLRGRSVVVFDGAVLLEDDEAEAVIAPLRALAPEMNTFARVPAATLTTLHMDPPQPTPGVGGGIAIDRLDDEAIEAFLSAVGPQSSTDLLIAELRLLGGALSRVPQGAGAVEGIEGTHLAFVMAVAPTPEVAAASEIEVERVLEMLAPFEARWLFLNLADRPVDVSRAFTPPTWQRLRQVKAAVDPDGMFLANHAI